MTTTKLVLRGIGWTLIGVGSTVQLWAFETGVSTVLAGLVLVVTMIQADEWN